MNDATTSRKQKWMEKIELWKASGKSITSWCKENNIPYNTFLYWRKRLGFMQENNRNRTSTFIELQEENSSFSGIEIHINEVSLHLSQKFDERVLIRCLCLLRGS